MSTPKLKQIEKFREAAREAGGDDSEAGFDRALKRVVQSGKKPRTAKKEESDNDKTK